MFHQRQSTIRPCDNDTLKVTVGYKNMMLKAVESLRLKNSDNQSVAKDFATVERLIQNMR
jgi:hypothetical protein